MFYLNLWSSWNWVSCGESWKSLLPIFLMFHRTDFGGFLVCCYKAIQQLNGVEKNSVAISLMLNHNLTGLLDNFFSSLFTISISWIGSIWGKNKLASSAKRMKSKAFDTLHKSLMYNETNNGPKVDPWGTAPLIHLEEESEPLYCTNWVLRERWLLNHCNATPQTPPEWRLLVVVHVFPWTFEMQFSY